VIFKVVIVSCIFGSGKDILDYFRIGIFPYLEMVLLKIILYGLSESGIYFLLKSHVR
jgi:hypothetical protein